MLHSVFFLLAVCGLGLGARPAPEAQDTKAEDTRSFGVATCRIEKPVSWNDRRVTWIGTCRAGHADGLGALQSDTPGLAREVFLGRVSEGYLRNGVLVTEQGYTAGSWKAGKLRKIAQMIR